MEIHPDKDVILELFGTTVTDNKKDCGCSSCSNKHKERNEHYMNATGSEAVTNTNSNTLAHQTNVILVVATLFIATALILKNK